MLARSLIGKDFGIKVRAIAMQNPRCDQGNCKYPDGEIREIPLTRPDACGSQSFGHFCQHCYKNVFIPWRRRQNDLLAEDAQYPLPAWESLTLCKEE